MIREKKLKEVASFDTEEISIKDLRKINL